MNYLPFQQEKDPSQGYGAAPQGLRQAGKGRIEQSGPQNEESEPPGPEDRGGQDRDV